MNCSLEKSLCILSDEYFLFAVSEVSEKVYQGSRNGTYMTVSKVTLMTSASDDGAVIKCRASHPALLTGAIYPHLEDAVNLTIYCKTSELFTIFERKCIQLQYLVYFSPI